MFGHLYSVLHFVATMKTIVLFMALMYLNAENAVGLINSNGFMELKESDLKPSTLIKALLQNRLEKRNNIGTLVFCLIDWNDIGHNWRKYPTSTENEAEFTSNEVGKYSR